MGVAAASLRPLGEAERAELEGERRALGRRAALLAVATPLLFVVGLFLCGLLTFQLPSEARPLGLLALLLMFVGDAALALRAVDAMRRRRRIRADLARGEVASFEGHTRAAVNERTRMLLAREGFPVDGALGVVFEALCGTGRLWTVGGARSRSWVLLPFQTPAAVPAHASVAANWVKPVASQGSATLLARSRPLSTDERTEIAALQRRTLRRNARPILAGLFGVALLAPSALRGEGSLRPVAIAVCAFIVMSLGRTIARDFRLARALLRDSTNGVVHVLRTRVADDAEMSAPTEVLPLSRVAWTQAGEPSPWRRGSGAQIARG